MIQIHTNAAKQIARIIEDENRSPNTFLRVRVEKGGCSGMTYKLDFEDTLQEKDKVFEQHGVKVVVDSKSLLYVAGTELNFSGGLNGTGFTFQNPNAKKTCGCGTSFAV